MVHLSDVSPGSERFQRDPGLVQRFYNERRRQLRDVRPNAAHEALARLERDWPGGVLLVTQNVDDLHDRAGSQDLIHMHGELRKVRCLECGRVSAWDGDVQPDSACPGCGRARLRPHIVWFGEMPFELERIARALDHCGLFVAIGTSGQVYPAAGFVQQVGQSVPTLELNLEASMTRGIFRESRQGPATVLVPRFVAELVGEAGNGHV